MRLIDYLDKGAQLGPAQPCLTMGDANLSYDEVQRISLRDTLSIGNAVASFLD